jgi:hypothetical protein
VAHRDVADDFGGTTALDGIVAAGGGFDPLQDGIAIGQDALADGAIDLGIVVAEKEKQSALFRVREWSGRGTVRDGCR